MFGGNAYALIFLAALWLVFCILFRDLRREQILTSIAAATLFPILTATVYANGPSDHLLMRILLLFFASGISSIIYHIIFGQYYLKTPRHLVHHKKTEEMWAWKWTGLIFIAMWTTLLFAYIWPSLPTYILFLLTALLFCAYYAVARQDLLFDALMSAGLMIAIFAMVDLVLGGISGSVFGIELYLHAAGLGLFFGPLYEFARNLRLHHVFARI